MRIFGTLMHVTLHFFSVPSTGGSVHNLWIKRALNLMPPLTARKAKRILKRKIFLRL